MQSTKLSDYLTPRENRKIDRILDRAAKRVKKQNGDTTARAFVFLKCPLQKSKSDSPEFHPECWKEMPHLLMCIEEFCKSNGCCPYTQYVPEGEDDELPFD